MEMDAPALSPRFSRKTLLQASAGVLAGSAAMGANSVGASAAQRDPAFPSVRPEKSKLRAQAEDVGGVVFSHEVPPPEFDAAPGPAPLAPAVVAALTTPVIPQGDPAFADVFTRAQVMAGQVLQTKHDIIMMQGEAILSLEAAFRGVTRPGMTALNLVSGVYGDGYTTWLKSYGAKVLEIRVPYNQSIDPSAVDAMLSQHPEVELVSMVHVDTPSGTKNFVDQIGPIAKRHGSVTLVDAASTLGGMPLYPDLWDLDIVVGASQKCLAGPVGIGIMSVSADAWNLIAKNPNAPTNSYMSMTDWKEFWLGEGIFPYGPSITNMYGVEAALSALLDEGLAVSLARHALAARAFRSGMTGMGLQLWPASEAIASDTNTTIALPGSLKPGQVVSHLRQRYGGAISGTTLSGGVSGPTIRVGHMGVQANPMFVIQTLSAVGQSLADFGVRVDVGAGLQTALTVLASTLMSAHPATSPT